MGLYTYKDAIDHCLDFLGGDTEALTTRDAKKAIQLAYRELAEAHTWTYYYSRGRLPTVPPYATGTVAYVHTGGANERQLTLTGGTWPTWATFGTVILADIYYEVAEYISASVITLSANSNPGADVASGTAYNLVRDTYPLPTDFGAMDRVEESSQWLAPDYVHPRYWLSRDRAVRQPATPRVYTVRGDPNYFGALAISFAPAPERAYTWDFIYRRRPRPLVVDEYRTGTVSVTSGNAAVTGSGTTFLAGHVGSILRVAADATNYPTGVVGDNPAAAERTLLGFTSTTAVTADATWPDTLSGVKFSLSDPVDLDEGGMLEAFLACCQKQLAALRNMKTKGEYAQTYQDALQRARAGDARNQGPRIAGGSAGRYYPRLVEGRLGSDLS